MPIRFRRERAVVAFGGHESTGSEVQYEVRFDPLLKTSARIGATAPCREKLADLRPVEPPVSEPPASVCSLCPPQIERNACRFLDAIVPGGRLQVGETTVLTDAQGVSQFGAVALLAHTHLTFAAFTPGRLAENLAASLQYVQAVYRVYPAARQCAYNLAFSTHSGTHPHAQIFLDPLPTTMMRLQQQATEAYWHRHGKSFWEDLIEEERTRRERFLASIGRTYWLTAFAPLADREVVGIVSGRASLLDLDHEDLEALAEGISRALAYYRASDLDGFDLSLFSAPLDQTSSYRVNLSLAARTSLACPAEEASYFGPLQREAVVGMTPESLARELRSYFAPPSAL